MNSSRTHQIGAQLCLCRRHDAQAVPLQVHVDASGHWYGHQGQRRVADDDLQAACTGGFASGSSGGSFLRAAAALKCQRDCYWKAAAAGGGYGRYGGCDSSGSRGESRGKDVKRKAIALKTEKGGVGYGRG